MFSTKRTDKFNAWLSGMKDSMKDGMTHRRLPGCLHKASLGNLGDVKQVADIARAVKLAATIEE